MTANDTETKYEVTDALRKKYTDISISFDTANLRAQGYHPVFIEKLVELLPVINSSVRDMSIIEAELMINKTGLLSMFDGVSGMEDASQYIRHEAFKVAVEKNKNKVLKQISEHWNAAVEQATPLDTPDA